MKKCYLQSLLMGALAVVTLLATNLVMAEPTLPEVYQAVQSGQMAKADAMMKEVLQNHPNSAKAHFVAAELYLKEGQIEVARNQFLQAENLAPGLPFAQPESVRKLQAALARGDAASVPANTGVSSMFTSPIFWILMAILGAGIIFFLKSRNRPAPVQVYNAPSAGYPGASGGPVGYPGAPGVPAAGGMGGGLMGSLATGAALGAGMYAGQALASHLMGGHDASNLGNMNPNLNQVGGPAADNPNFGVSDTGSWDDSGSSSWDDSGGGDFMSDV